VASGYLLKTAAAAVLALAVAQLEWQAHRASFVAYEDPGNPYVYAHTTSDVPLLAQCIREIAAVHPDRLGMHVQVVCPDDDHWPLPWYLRDFTSVDWAPKIPRGPAAPLIITKPEMEQKLAEYLYVKQPPGQRYLYVPVPRDGDGEWRLRPNVFLRPYVRLELLETFQAGRAEETPIGAGEAIPKEQ
jgi:hypothetical protein